MLVVVVIVAMLLSAVVAAMLPVLHAPGAASARYDTIVPADAGLYTLERDLRLSDARGVFACSVRPIACGAGSTDHGSQAIAIATALSSAAADAPFTLDRKGYPNWQGFVVYWQPRSGGVVYRTFEAAQGMSALIAAGDRAELEALAESAVASAGGGTGGGTSGGGSGSDGPAVALHDISFMAAAVDLPAEEVQLQLSTAAASGDRANDSSYETHVFTRN